MRAVCLLIPVALVVPASGNQLEFGLLLPAVSGPPYPTEFVGWGLSTGIGGLPAVQRGGLLAGLNAVAGDGSVMPASLLGGPAATSSEVATLNLSTEPFKIVNQTELFLAGLGTNGLLLPAVIQGFSWGERSFDVVFETAPLTDGTTNRFHLRGDLVLQDFHFNTVNALLGDGSVRVLFESTPMQGQAPRSALAVPSDAVVMTITGVVAPEPASLILLGIGAAAICRRRPRGIAG